MTDPFDPEEICCAMNLLLFESKGYMLLTPAGTI
jgi:hypothetical protein